MPEPLLSVQNLIVSFSSKNTQNRVLSDFNLALYPGQCMGLVGESGSGKTMAGLSILQLLPHGALVDGRSQIMFDGRDLLSLPEKSMRRVRGNRISMIFQDALSALNPVLTIGAQLNEVLQLHLRLSKRQSHLRGIELLDAVGIQDPVKTHQAYPHQLSGGMRQRAMIAMAIAAEPDVLIADEPTTALDVTIQAQVLDLLKKLQREKNCALLFVGHDLSVVAQMADEMTVLEKGLIVEKAKTKEFFANPKQPYSQKLLSAVLPDLPKKSSINVSNDVLLDVKNLSIAFSKKVNVVSNVSFQIKKGETVALVGESGSGKTTTAKGILQLLKQMRGDVIIENTPLSQLSRTKLRSMRSHMQLIFQDPAAALNPRMLVLDCLAEGLIAQRLVKNAKQAESIVDDLLHKVHLPLESKWRYPHEFSGGQKQRLCIARALSLSPKLLILDEPTSALDVSIQKQILDLLNQLQDEKQLSYLLITHNLSVVAYLAHRILVMYRGEIVEAGDVQTILTAPQHEYTKQLLSAVPKITEGENQYA